MPLRAHRFPPSPKANRKPLGATTQRAFDRRGNRISVTGPDGATVTVDYDARNLPVGAVDVLGGVWRWVHDGAGDLVEEETPAGGITRYGHACGLLK